MAISEMKMRKNELEDITNTSKSKLSFVKLEKKEKPKAVTFENYLLTPKDEDYYDDDEEDLVPQHEEPKLEQAMTPVEEPEVNESQDLDRNPDYIALTSSLRLLKSNKDKISNEIVELSQLSEFFKQCQDEKEIMKFLNKLLTNKLNLPKQNKILKCPMIKISKYEPQPLKLNLNEKPLFKTLNLFNNS
ncbi:hypothetical protein PSN45_001875 [Yamadazyma tenuis]|uniref:Uncharacterized protein n=1 Tax=Candida tenuis (strain ATCC 10573 / BCRC 21748 / CBS 615 / JCM 9827 / NBRC 10315 / NRRL Y-1498 / VKM Y-70) TaxID=590646 RepID=G3BDR8_CANTC|nr:uncharacterized protein CANTEDRAFT_95817 [Yamadazyma tenuis ATCC 10573]EGV60364.1 hypothetical protein CANTEDRAFT_95817 [Yamadazyma tenuis ATCC 10573]WEJ94391.1 hypothetical protein PSN45_001875 [Yamadazyma tenuis]